MGKTKIDETIILKDGRTLGFAEYGDLSGRAVFHFNGSGGSRLEHPADLSILTELGVRLITTDRPGHGLSDPQSKRNLLNWPNDISELADQLGLEEFYIVGHSAGGPYALACAYKLPDRIKACGIVSGLAPYDRPNPYRGLSFSYKILMCVIRNYPKINYFLRKQMSKALQGDIKEVEKKLISGFPKEDQAHLAIPENLKMLINDIKEGYRQGSNGPAQDDIVINSPWGFPINKIEVPTFIWHGDKDKNIPCVQGEYQHQMIRNSKFILVKGQAHLYLFSMWKEILAKLTNTKLPHHNN